MTARPVALVAWELGGGRGHVEHLRPIVAALLADGWQVVAAMRDVAGATAAFGTIDPALRARRLTVGQAPIFVHRAPPIPAVPGSLAEVLAHTGFADAEVLRPVVSLWRTLIDAVRPSVILADFAPSAVAAAHRRIPVVMIGNGWTIPPDGAPVPPADRRGPRRCRGKGGAADRRGGRGVRGRGGRSPPGAPAPRRRDLRLHAVAARPVSHGAA